jgi:hypothetical protein
MLRGETIDGERRRDPIDFDAVLGLAGHGKAWRGAARPGEAWLGVAWRCTARLGLAWPGAAWRGEDLPRTVVRGVRLLARGTSVGPGRARRGTAGLGGAGHGRPGRGWARRGEDLFLGWSYAEFDSSCEEPVQCMASAWQGVAWQCVAGRGKAWNLLGWSHAEFDSPHEDKRDPAWRGSAGQGVAGLGQARHGMARQGVAFGNGPEIDAEVRRGIFPQEREETEP